MNYLRRTTVLNRLTVPFTVFVALTLVFVSTTPVVHAAEPRDGGVAPWQVEDLDVPITNYLILDSVLGEDANGNPTLYGSTYNKGGDGVTFFGIDPITGEHRIQKKMPEAYGGYHVAKAPDGSIYLGPQNAEGKPQIWRYDPISDDLDIVATAPEGNFCFGIAVSEVTGKVYCGAYGKGIYEWDPNSDAMRLVTETRQFPKGIVPVDEDTLLLAQGSPASVLSVDLDTGETEEILPSTYASMSFAYNAVHIGDYIYVQLVNDGDAKIIRYDAITLDFSGEIEGLEGMSFSEVTNDHFYALGAGGLYKVEPADSVEDYVLTDTGIDTRWMVGNRLWPVDIDGETWLTSINRNQSAEVGLLGRFNPSTGAVWTHELDLPGEPTNITALHSGPDGKIYGGTYETNQMFSYDPETEQTHVLGHIAPGNNGEILSMQMVDGKLFTGSYHSNIVTVFDPEMEWNPGTTEGSNPRELGSLGDEQNRPWDMTLGSDGRVWIASSANYGQLGGAITAVDPDTLEVESFRGLSGDEHMFSITNGDGVLYVGTSRWGDATDTETEAKLLTFDLSTKEVIDSVVPVPAAGRIWALETAPDGTIYGLSGTTLFKYSPITKQSTIIRGFTGEQILGLKLGPDGYIYGHSAERLFRINPETDKMTTMAYEHAAYYRTVAFDADGRLYWGGGPSLLRIDPNATLPPFISEIHYDNVGPDVGEAIEIQAEPGTSLDGWSLLLYDGDNGTVYDEKELSGTVDSTGTYVVEYGPPRRIQNGPRDGIALIYDGDVMEFLSYEGDFVATDGPAQGMRSIDIGVAETSSTPEGMSLQRINDVWVGPLPESFGNTVKISATDLKSSVQKYKVQKAFENDQTAKALHMHLTAVSHYEKNGEGSKVMKHLKSFNSLLEYQKNNELISDEVYQSLKTSIEVLTMKWK